MYLPVTTLFLIMFPCRCFINKKYAYFVFYVPVLLCIIFNCVVFALVAPVIFRSKAAGQVSEQQQKKVGTEKGL